MHAALERITPQQAGSLPGLFLARARATPQAVAYRHYQAEAGWIDTSWGEMLTLAARWRAALAAEQLVPGERVAVMLRNCREWVLFDQAALSLGLVVVPLYVDDRADNAVSMLGDAGVRLLLVPDWSSWRALAQTGVPDSLGCVLVLAETKPVEGQGGGPRVTSASAWLEAAGAGNFALVTMRAEDLATIVYTSGTTGKPKGVMLTHGNILENAYAASQCAQFLLGDVFLSFLPLSHMLERTAGYYMPMMTGGLVAYSRSVALLAEDLRTLKPEVLISVPRIYERMYARIYELLAKQPLPKKLLLRLTLAIGWHRFQVSQKRGLWGPDLLLWPLLSRKVASRLLEALGGRLRFAISGGAALPPPVARFFLALGAPIFQGYGMTEASPVVCVNRPESNVPDSVGLPLPGVEVRLGKNHELLVRGPNLMPGFWNNPEATAKAIDSEGWLRSGDQARIDARGHVFLTGRIKDIIVLSNGEKVPPTDMEAAIEKDAAIEQALVLGEGRPFLAALLVINPEGLTNLCQSLGVKSDDLSSPRLLEGMLARVNKALKGFPGYARVRRVALIREPWTVENGLLTATLKPRRAAILKHHAPLIDALYQGHGDKAAASGT